MISTVSKHVVVCSLLALGAGCNVGELDHKSIAVHEQNKLGVTSIEIDQATEGLDKVFELRGYDENQQQVGLVRLHVGLIADLAEYLPATKGEIAAEITLSAAGAEQRLLTRSLDRFELQTPEVQAARDFVELAAVSSALEAEANIVFDTQSDVSSSTGGETEYTASACNASFMNVSPLAKQCCYGHNSPTQSGGLWTNHINPTNSWVHRKQNPSGGAACKASDGVSACSGAACYYGPNGFGKPVVSAPSGTYPFIAKSAGVPSGFWCEVAYYASDINPKDFGDKVGTFSTGQGCPGGATGAGLWDY